MVLRPPLPSLESLTPLPFWKRFINFVRQTPPFGTSSSLFPVPYLQAWIPRSTVRGRGSVLEETPKTLFVFFPPLSGDGPRLSGSPHFFDVPPFFHLSYLGVLPLSATLTAVFPTCKGQGRLHRLLYSSLFVLYLFLSEIPRMELLLSQSLSPTFSRVRVAYLKRWMSQKPVDALLNPPTTSQLPGAFPVALSNFRPLWTAPFFFAIHRTKIFFFGGVFLFSRLKKPVRFLHVFIIPCFSPPPREASRPY